MAAGPNQATVNIEYLGPDGHSNQNCCKGTIVPNATVIAGGDYVLASQFGLGTIDELYLTIPHLVAGTAQSAIILAVVSSLLPARTGTVLIQYFSAMGTEATGTGLDLYAIPFLAFGS